MAVKKINGCTEAELRAMAKAKKYELMRVDLDADMRVAGFELACRHGHHFSASFGGGFFSGKLVCHGCAEVRRLRDFGKHTLIEIKYLAEKRRGTLLSKSYEDQKSKLEWKCEHGHNFWASLTSVKYSGTWCSVCSESAGESLTRQLCEELTGGKFIKARPPWLLWKTGSCLELDGYCEKLSIAFEYQGRQHYEFDPYFHSNIAEFEDQLARDSFKRLKCEENDVKLVVVSYEVGQMSADIKRELLRQI